MPALSHPLLRLALLSAFIGAAAAQGVWAPQTTVSAGLRDDLYGISFPDAKHGWAVGVNHGNDTGVILSTADGGTTWTRSTLDSVRAFTAVRFTSPDTGWLLGSARYPAVNGMFKTVDGGSHWVPQDAKLIGAYEYFLDADHGWIGGYRTTNGGATWDPLGIGPDAPALSVSFINPDTGWTLGGATGIRKSVDGGAHWTPQVSGTTNPMSSIFFADGKRGWATGYSSNTSPVGLLLATTDGGTTWTPRDIGSIVGTLYCVSFPGKDTGWAMGRFGYILFSVDGGTTWTVQDRVTDKGLRSFVFVDAKTGWAAGDAGTILKYGGDATTGLRVQSMRGKSGQPIRKAVYHLSSASRVQARILDARGKVVSILFDGIQSAGDHELGLPQSIRSGKGFLDFKIDGVQKALAD